MKDNFDDLYYPKDIYDILHENTDEKMITHITRANEGHMQETSMQFLGENFSYADLFANIIEYARSLKKYGLQKGDCITLAMPNVPDTVYYFYACNEIGVTPYLIDPRSTFNNMVTCIKDSNSKLFICELGTYYDKVADRIDELPVDNVIVVSPVNSLESKDKLSKKAKIAKQLYNAKTVLENLKHSKSIKTINQKKFIKLGKDHVGNLETEYDPDIPAIIVNTSGTTGSSIKGAMHSNKTYNLYTNEAQFVTDQLTRGNTYYGYIPYFSMYGSCVGMHTALSYGVIINNIPKFDGKKTLEDIIESKANILIGTPNIIEKLHEMYMNDDIDASHVKQYIVGGDNMSPDKLKKIDEDLLKKGMARKLVYGYGATECMPISTMCPDERSHLYGSTGIVYPNAHIKILDPETKQELGFNEEGEIYVNNPTMMIGYLKNEEETKSVLVDIDGKTYYKTGDKGYLNETGHLYLTGRYKRMMKRPDGHQVSPIPIENLIQSNDVVKDCAVIGIKRNTTIPGVIPTAFVVMDKTKKIFNDEITLSQIASYVNEHISGEREAALAYVIVDQIPQTINGKADFNKLKQNTFEDLDFYVIDDPITEEYFADFKDIRIIRINKEYNRALRKN